MNSYVPIPINITPSYVIITDGGKSHFSRVSDALAEFVDNSIQACRDVESRREISINFIFTSAKNGFVVISDNGCGMDEKCLTDYATYALDQKTRGLSAEANNPSFISKFGVGAKQAGFFLGDRIRVVTKAAGSSTVLELLLDGGELKRRFEAKSNDVFMSVINPRSQGARSLSIPADEAAVPELVRILNEHEGCEEQFTSTIIRLHADTVRALVRQRDNCSDVADELASIFHYHMHPEHLPHRIVEMDKFKGRFGRSGANGAITQILGDAPILPNSELRIEFGCSYDGTTPPSVECLSNKEDIMQMCIDRAEDVFPFLVEVPDPLHHQSLSGNQQAAVVSRLLDGEHTGAGTHNHRLRGIFLYCPYKNGRETRPSILGENPKGTINSRSSRSSTAGAAVDDDGDVTDDASDALGEGADDLDSAIDVIHRSGEFHLIRCFWQNRMLSESHLDALPFFPSLRTSTLPENWKGRIVGCLFFDWNFRHISNNKLKVNVAPHLQGWINGQKNIIYRPIGLGRRENNPFHKWLELCHNDLDREFSFDRRDRELEALGENRSSIFKRLIIGNGRCVVEAETIVKIIMKRTKRQVKTVFGRIKSFEVNPYLSPELNEFHGVAKVRYVREPVEVFGGEEEAQPIQLSRLLIEEDEHGTLHAAAVSPEELRAVSDESPHKVQLKIFESESSNSSKLVKDVLKITVGEQFHCLGVQIIDGKGDKIAHLPQACGARRIKYKVHLEVPGLSYDLGKTSELHARSEVGNKFTTVQVTALSSPQQRKLLDNAFFGFWEFSMKNRGEYTLDARVLVGNREVFKKSFKLIVEAKIPTDFRIDLINCEDNIPRPLGTGLPSFQLEFRDQFQNPLSFEGQFECQLTAPGLEVKCDEVMNPSFVMESSEEGALLFVDQQWSVEPLELDGSFLNPSQVENRPVDFTMRLFIARNPLAEEGDRVYDVQIGTPKSFTISFAPGYPHEILQMEPSRAILQVMNGEAIPNIRLACLDKWGNRTAPRPGMDWSFIVPENDWVIAEEEKVPVLASGEALIHGLSLLPCKKLLLKEGEEVDVEIELDCHTSGKGKREVIDFELPAPFKLTLQVKPAYWPDRIEILCGNQVIQSSLRVPAGSTITDLTYRVLDESNSIREPEDYWFKEKGSGVQVNNWGEGQPRVRNPRSNQLPDIKVPTATSTHPLECSVDVDIAGMDMQLSFQFAVEVTPGRIIGWKLISSPDLSEGIMCGDLSDLREKIRGVCLEDEFGNLVNYDSAAHIALPELMLSWTDPASPTAAEDEEEAEDGEEGGENKSMEIEGGDEEAAPRRRSKRKHANISSPAAGQEQRGSKKPRGEGNHAAITVDVMSALERRRDRLVIPLELGSIRTTSASTAVVVGARPRSSRGVAGGASASAGADPRSGISRVDDDDVVGFVISESELKISKVASAWVCVRDKAGKYKSAVLPIVVTEGPPAKLLISSEALGIADPSAEHTVTVSRYTEASDLRLHFLDASGNACKMGKIKAIDLVIEDADRKVSVLKAPKVPKNSLADVSIKFSKLLASSAAEGSSGDVEVPLTISGSYKQGSVTVSLLGAVLHCRFRKLNVVNSLEVSLVKYNDSVGSGALVERDAVHLQHGSLTTVSADEPSFGLRIATVTDDGVVYVPDMKDINVSMKLQQQGADSKVLDLFRAIPPLVQGTGSYLTLAPADIGKLAVGLYFIIVTYTESRASMASLPTKKVEMNFRIRVEAGSIVRLEGDEDSQGIFEHASASNCALVKPEARIIAKNVIIRATDEFGNNGPIPEGREVVCSLRRSSPSDSNSPLPVLVGAHDGILRGQVSQDLFHVKFPQLELVAGEGSGDGSIDVIFSLLPTVAVSMSASDSSARLAGNGGGNLLLQPWVVSFNFTTDQNRIERAGAIKAELQPLLEELRTYKEKEDYTRNVLRKVSTSITAKLQQASSDQLRRSIADPARLTHSQASQLSTILASQLHQLESSTRLARNKQAANQTLLAEHSAVGQVVDLASVEDLQMARLVSWAMEFRMDVVVVPDSLTADRLYDVARRGHYRMKVLSLDQVSRPFQVRGSGGVYRPRNEEEKRRGELPFQNDLRGVRGNPRYLVNQLRLDPSNEHLRDTVFYTFLKDALVFDDLPSATNYRRRLVAEKRSVPVIITMQGDKIARDGVMDTAVGAGTLPAFNQTNFVFGFKPQASGDYQRIEADLKVLTDISDLLAEREASQEALDSLTAQSVDINRKRVRASELQNELKSLNLPGEPRPRVSLIGGGRA